MAFGVGDELSVRVSANTSSFTRGMEDAQDGLNSVRDASVSTGAALEALEQIADDTGDELGSMGSKAARGGSIFTAFTASTEGLSFSFTVLSTLTTLTLIPAFASLATTLVPIVATVGALTAGIGALAAAFGAVIGSGILAFGAQRARQNRQELQQVNQRIEALEELKETVGELPERYQEELAALKERRNTLQEQTTVMGGLQSAVADLKAEIGPLLIQFGEQFIPLIEDAIEALPNLVANILDSVGSLDAFRDTLRELGNIAFRVIPEIVNRLANLARRVLPGFRRFVDFLIRTVPPAFNASIRTAREFDDELIDLGRTTVGLIPDINRLGSVLLETLLPALERALNITDRLFNRFSNLNAENQRFVGLIATLTPLVAGLINLLGGPLTVAIAAIAGAFLAVREAYNRNILGIRDRFERLVPVLRDNFRAVQDIAQAFASGFNLQRIRERLDRFVQTLLSLSNDFGPQVINVLERFGEALRNNEEFFRRLGEVATPFFVRLIDLIAIATKGLFFLAENVVIPFLNGVVTIIDELLGKLTTLLETIQEVSRGDFTAAVETVIGSNPLQEQQRQRAIQQQQAGQDVTLRVEGEGRLPELIREEAEVVVEEQSRTTNRRTGRTTSISR